MHGYCTDDVARALLVVLRAPEDPEHERLSRVYLDFLLAAQRPDGSFANRRAWPSGAWLLDEPASDADGRALRALGAASSSSEEALAAFERASHLRSPWPRVNASMALGAVEVLRTRSDNRAAWSLLGAAADGLGAGVEPWRTYENALVPHALVAVGAEHGLELLDWLVEEETLGDHFSFAPVGGRAPGGPKPAFDQQPIEAGAMAEACACAFELHGDRRFAAACRRAADWFLGLNDVGVSLYDPETGGCRDGLEPHGCNANEGAESTIALLAATQAAARSAAASSRASTTAAPT